MKIVFLSFYSGFVNRGVETFVTELSKRLSKNHQVLVIQAGPIKNHPFPIKRIKVPMKWPEVNKRGITRKLMIDYYYRQIFWFMLKSLPIIYRFKPDVIIPTNGGWQSLLIKIYCLFSKSKMVISGQAGLGYDDKWNLLLKPDFFIALSKRNANWAKKHSKNVRIETIHNGVDLTKFRPEASKLRVNLQKPTILCVAGPEKYKRVKETIKAAAQLNKASLLVIGGSKKTLTLGRELLHSRFGQRKFPHNKMPAVYKNSDLFTLVSQSCEAFGISYLEAMACNLPIVATDDSLRREIIGKAGLFIKNPQNSKLYSETLKKALKKNWGNLPRKQAQKFSWDKVAKEYEEKVFKSI